MRKYCEYESFRRNTVPIILKIIVIFNILLKKIILQIMYIKITTNS